MSENYENDEQSQNSALETWQMIALGIVAASILFLLYQGGKHLFSSVGANVSSDTKKAIYNSAITVSEIASRLKY